jgi:D-serine deaminase-like pyridoxal phosphate-dependent protein
MGVTVPYQKTEMASRFDEFLSLDISTPALVVDVPRMDRNIRLMVDRLAALGISCRPHAKTHKSIEIARRQLSAGAIGITVATISEAEVFAAGGIDDIFIAYPVWAAGAKRQRLARLNDTIRLAVGVDSVPAIEHLAAAADMSVRPLRVLVELDSGEHRTGVPDSAGAVAVADAAATAGLEVCGVFTHGGHSYGSRAAARLAAADEVDVLGDAAQALRAAGHAVRVVSGGSTPSSPYAVSESLTELRPGTFVFGDRQQCALGGLGEDDLALVVLSTVVSRAHAGQVVLDAGAKVLSKDLPATVDGYGWLPRYPDAHITRLFDHHAPVTLSAGPEPTLGEVLAIVPNHACAVVNLATELVAVHADGSLEWWPVDAHSRNT